MPKLKLPESSPFQVETDPQKAEIEELVKEAIGSEHVNKTAARDLFIRHGLDLKTVAESMNKLLNFGEESTKIKILQDLLKIHGALEPEVESKSVSINFSFAPRSNSDPDPMGKIQVLIPR